jgi:hypothetical protein
MFFAKAVADFWLWRLTMDEMRFIEADEDYVFLESADGVKFRLQIDDQLRAATKRVTAAITSTLSVSPREIQERVRSGASVSQLAESTGMSVELISKFAAPVLDEIAFVVNTALSVRLTFAGARPNTTEQIEFGEVIASRLRASGASAIEWSAIKLEGSTWRLRAAFLLASEAHEAAWLFEPKKLSLAPDNDMAIRLSTEETISTKVASPLRVVEEHITVPSAAVVAETIPNDTMDAEFDHQIDVDASSTTDLLEALRKKRESRKVQQVEQATPSKLAAIETPNSEIPVVSEIPDAVPNGASDLDTTPELDVKDINDDDVAKTTSAPVASTKPAAKKSRTSMPSWDEIVFGAKADD